MSCAWVYSALLHTVSVDTDLYQWVFDWVSTKEYYNGVQHQMNRMCQHVEDAGKFDLWCCAA